MRRKDLWSAPTAAIGREWEMSGKLAGMIALPSEMCLEEGLQSGDLATLRKGAVVGCPLRLARGHGGVSPRGFAVPVYTRSR